MATSNPSKQKNTFISDKPSAVDALDFNPYVKGLATLISAPETETPITISITGSWGSGKTSLMQLLEREVYDQARKRKAFDLKCLWVNVWQVSQQGEGGQALLQALFTEVRARLGLFRRVVFDWYLLRDRIDVNALIRQVLVNSYRALIVIAPLLFVRFIDQSHFRAAGVDETRASQSVALLLALWLVVKPMIEAAREKVSLDLGAILKDAPYEIKVSALQKLQAHFRRLVTEWVGKNGRIAVFIDDLDRCPPDKIAEVLEALKLFATTEGCVYVLGLDQDIVARSIQVRYKDITGGADGGTMPLEGVRYLEKIIQIPFILPLIEVADIRKYVNSFNAAWPHEGCADIFIRCLPPNPRQIKRAVNLFFLLWRLTEARREKLESVTHLRLAKLVVLQTAHPDLFEWSKRMPKLLKNFEDYYQRSPDEQRLLEEEVGDSARFREAVGRPDVKRLFEMLLDDPLAKFGGLDQIKLESFFSLTGEVVLTGQTAVSAGATAAEERGAGSLQEPPAGGDVQARQDRIVMAGDYFAPAAPVINALHQLPPPPRDFTGRASELAELMSQVERGVTISGQGGTGKTALALKLAEQLTPRYPDAQLYLDLKGTSNQQPVTVAEALCHVIQAFYPTAKPPEDFQQLRSLYLTVLNDRRVLLLMDNARDAAQVEPLIPPDPCVLLITSRQHFTLPGMVTVGLDTLTPAESSELLLKIAPQIGEQADEIAKLCGYLPLALRLAASALAERVNLSPADYVRRLSDAQKRLELVEASLTLSYDLLSPDLQKLWRTLSVFPDTFDAAAAAAVWRTREDAAQDALGDLIRFSMVDWDSTTGRYHLNDLARLFADASLSEQERSATQMDHAAYYLRVLGECDHQYLRGGEAMDSGLAVFDAERRNIDAGQRWASEHAGEDEKAATLCSAYPDAGPYVLNLRQHPRERILWLEAALMAAGRLKDRAAEGRLFNKLGIAYAELGKMPRAIELHGRALQIEREIDDRRGEGVALGNLGNAYAGLGDYRTAIEFYEQSLSIDREIGDRRGEGQDLGNLGLAYAELGETQRAIEFYEQRLVIAREIGDRYGEGNALGNLGLAYDDLGETRRAVEFYERQLVITREIGDRRGEANTLFNTSLALDKLGDRAQAIAHAEAALEIFEQIESPSAKKAHAALAQWRGEA
jgi:tetratricopeptide (TPR) repeat protein